MAVKMAIEQNLRRKFVAFCLIEQKGRIFMELSERNREIYSLITAAGYMSVAELARRIYTSQSTVRRSLDELERQGYIHRIHGGAETVHEIATPLNIRAQKNRHQKLEIGRLAAKYAEGKRVIFIDESSTTLCMIPFLPHEDITVWTNGAETAYRLGEQGIRVISTGGEYNPKYRVYTGTYPLEVVNRMYFDAAFFSCSSFDQGIISGNTEAMAELKRVLIKQSRESYFLCDSSKLGKMSPYIVCREHELTKVICI